MSARTVEDLRRNGRLGRGEVVPSQTQRHVDQADQRRDLDQRANDSGKGSARADAENRHRDGNGKLEVVRAAVKASVAVFA